MSRNLKIMLGVSGLTLLGWLFLREPQKKKIRNKILRIVGTIESNMNYGEVFVDPGVELSYGILQTRMKHGGLGRLLDMYMQEGDAQYKSELQAYLPRVRSEDRSLERDAMFKSLLKKMGQDPAMQRVQDEYFDKYYLDRAYKWAEEKGFKLPISKLAIVDTFIHSGSQAPFSWAGIHQFPVDGVDEKWTMQKYLTWRYNWLKRKGGALTATAFRPKLYLDLIARDPELEGPVQIRSSVIT